MSTPKTTPEMQAVINEAEAIFRAPSTDGKDMKENCPYTFTSNCADAYYITAWALYHTGKKPLNLHKSKGHTWKADIYGQGEIIVTVEHPDHREGIKIHGEQPQLKMMLIEANGTPSSDWIPYDGRRIADHEATNLPNYYALQHAGRLRHWTQASGHTGFLILRSARV